MKERPILFSAPMVRAILEGRKTQTRRGIKPQPPSKWDSVEPVLNQSDGHQIGWTFFNSKEREDYGYIKRPFPYGVPGDRLWVRETFVFEDGGNDYMVDVPKEGTPYKEFDVGTEWERRVVPHYKATEPDCNIVPIDCDSDDDRTRWKPSIHMPRWASRISLEVTAVRVERLRDISEVDAIAEGIEHNVVAKTAWRNYQHDEYCFSGPRESYRTLWELINGADSWDLNPWVWVIEFRRLK